MAAKGPAFGVQVACDGVSWAELLEISKAAEAAGYESVWTADHYVSTPDSVVADPRADLLDGWMTLGAMAMATRTLRIGPLVTDTLFRHPGVLAKMAVTVDHISGGRLEFGIGAGWFTFEHESMGIEFPKTVARLRRMEEAIKVIKSLWTQPETTFEGKYYKYRGALSNPKPLQKPWPPICIGATGEKVSLRIVAEHADHWNTYTPLAQYGRKAAALEAHCRAVGRDPKQVRRSLMVPLFLHETEEVKTKLVRWQKMIRAASPEQAREWFLVGTKREIQQKLDAFEKQGVQLFILQLDEPGKGAQRVREFAREFM
jgi:F420-dependent oxidoreductase-like protein